MRDDLSALVFELQRAGSKVEKAKSLARAWRTVRGLSATERRLLAREVGFDGAEDLIEGLAGKGGGVFAPAAVLEALGKMRREEGLSLRGILSGLRDPDKRDDLLVRGIDLVADSLERPEEEDDPQEWTDGSVDFEIPPPAPTPGRPRVAVDSSGQAGDDEMQPRAVGHGSAVAPEERPPPPPLVESPTRDVVADEAATEEPEPEPAEMAPPTVIDPSSWDEMWDEPDSRASARPRVIQTQSLLATRDSTGTKRARSSVLDRLRAFRESIPTLGNTTVSEIRVGLEGLPEAWARRRALVALIEADVPDDVGQALDLIEDLDRPMDRRWCLSALAVRGDLAGADLERALGMLTSPAARRRVAGLARAEGLPS